MSQFRDADDEEEEEEEEDESGSSVSGDEGGEEWVETDEQPCRSLLDASFVGKTVEEALARDGELGLDVAAFSALDQYDRIRVVNWSRRGGRASEFAANRAVWADDAFLRPELEDDPYRMWSPPGDELKEEGKEGEDVVLDDRLRDELEAVDEALQKQGIKVEDLQ